MKQLKKLILLNLMFCTLVNIVKAQTETAESENNEDALIAKTENETYRINGAYNFTITKTDNKTGKVLYTVQTKIPDKKNGEFYNTMMDKISAVLVGNEIQLIYDLYNKNDKQKQCLIKTLDISGTNLSEQKLLTAIECNSPFSVGNTVFRVIYSPDKSKFALLSDNFSKGFTIEPSIVIYDSKSKAVLATKKPESTYNGSKIQINPYKNFSIDNAGNITVNFSTMNEATNISTATFEAKLPFDAKSFLDIKPLGDAVAGAGSEGTSKMEHGRFYKSLEDFNNNKPEGDLRIESGTWSYAMGAGEAFKVIDKAGERKKMRVSDFSTPLISYKKSGYSSDFSLLRLDDNKSYMVLASGKYCYYVLYSDQGIRYFSEGISGKLEKCSQNDIEKLMKANGLLEDFEKDKPKREMKDDVNGYYNKTLAWHVKYFNILNLKLK